MSLVWHFQSWIHQCQVNNYHCFLLQCVHRSLKFFTTYHTHTHTHIHVYRDYSYGKLPLVKKNYLDHEMLGTKGGQNIPFCPPGKLFSMHCNILIFSKLLYFIFGMTKFTTKYRKRANTSAQEKNKIQNKIPSLQISSFYKVF